MGFVDIILLALIGVAFVAVIFRIRRKGTCGDCASAGSCSGHCGSGRKKSCPAMQGVDAVEEKLSRGIK